MRFDELVPLPAEGRRFTQTIVPGLGDAAPGGRIRLDALARWLQDVAHADVTDAGLAAEALWVVRRTRLRVQRFPRFGEPAALTTFASGLGLAWAERRTIVTTAGGARVEAVALWVHLDPGDTKPSPFSERELELYGPPAGGRRVKARLRHPAPPDGAPARPWHFRAVELDVADHINNAAYWSVLEEELLGGEEPASVDVELEFRTPAQPGEYAVLSDGDRRWVVASDGEVHASFAVELDL